RFSILLLTRWREERDSQRGDAERQYVQIMSASVSVEIRICVDCRADQRRIIAGRIDPELHPSAVARRHNVGEPWRGAGEVLVERRSKLTGPRIGGEAVSGFGVVVQQAEQRSDSCRAHR